MTEHRRALRAARPVLAGAVLIASEGRAVGLRAREDIVAVRCVAATVDDLALLRQRRLLGEVVLAVQVGDVLGDDDALGVGPGALADAVLRVHRAGPLRGQISVPGLAGSAGSLRQRRTMRVGTGEPAEVGALADALAGHEEGHVRLLPECGCGAQCSDQCGEWRSST